MEEEKEKVVGGDWDRGILSVWMEVVNKTFKSKNPSSGRFVDGLKKVSANQQAAKDLKNQVAS